MLCVEVVHNLLYRLAVVGIHCKDFFDDWRVHIVALIASLLIDFVAESNLPAVAYAFESVLFHTAHDLFCKLSRIVFRHAFQNAFQQYAFGTFRNALHCGNNLNAVLAQQSFVVCAVIAVAGEPVQLPHDNAVEGVFVAVFYHPLKFGAVVGLGGERSVYVIAYNVNARALGKFHAFAQLPFNRGLRLIIGTISRINYAFH